MVPGEFPKRKGKKGGKNYIKKGDAMKKPKYPSLQGD